MHAEYHLGCLYESRPRLFRKRREDAEAKATWNADVNGNVDGDATSASDDDDDDDRVAAPAYRVDDCVAGGVGTGPSSSTAGRLPLHGRGVRARRLFRQGRLRALALFLQSRIRVATITLK
jgi:hypothetical protein